ncbi:MAG: hypothetical protein ABSB67_20625, partial [Bryobacteraceae bacterium]
MKANPAPPADITRRINHYRRITNPFTRNIVKLHRINWFKQKRPPMIWGGHVRIELVRMERNWGARLRKMLRRLPEVIAMLPRSSRNH